ncbi:hypothetical protein FGO68_gene2997 [Halteria grandinella]|uniref:Uncharacterized protein n=1 Tax=Halteria grandinella TaxID=5974 RepID=A0A8J8NWN5_HALGN|nr:hypothetical protein FGO68_gene2997 [Halteria grandinella]
MGQVKQVTIIFVVLCQMCQKGLATLFLLQKYMKCVISLPSDLSNSLGQLSSWLIYCGTTGGNYSIQCQGSNLDSSARDEIYSGFQSSAGPSLDQGSQQGFMMSTQIMLCYLSIQSESVAQL